MNYLDTLDGFIRRFRTANFTITKMRKQRLIFGPVSAKRPAKDPKSPQEYKSFDSSLQCGRARAALCGPFRAALHHGYQPDRIRTRKWLEQRRIDDRETVVFARCLG
jgi:hypothetical protein